MAEKIVLAYSGGLDTSVAIPWLADRNDDQWVWGVVHIVAE